MALKTVRQIGLVLGVMLAQVMAMMQANAGESGAPMPNPYLIKGISALTHFDSAAQDRADVAGPSGIIDLDQNQIKLIYGGLVNIAYVTGHDYPTGEKVIWLVNNNRVAKVLTDNGQYKEIARYDFESAIPMPASRAEDITKALDGVKSDADLLGYVNKRLPFYMETISSRAGIYPMMSARGELYTVVDNVITVFADANPDDPYSPIVKKREFVIPSEAKHYWSLMWKGIWKVLTGEVPLKLVLSMLGREPDFALGLNMTYDGHVVFGMFGGTLGVIDQDFKKPLQYISFDEIISNSFSVDEQGGIYVVSESSMRKFVWSGSKLSDQEKDGAWCVPYGQKNAFAGGMRGGSKGSGSTPSLMGFGPDADRLVVITDGDPVMNLVAFWRDEIPADFVQQPGTPSRRMAGRIAVTFGQPDIKAVQSEQSVAVSGYGAFVVNNSMSEPTDSALGNLVVTGVTRPAAMGVEKLVWDPVQHAWQVGWFRKDVNSPSTVPLISDGSNQAYVNGIVDGKWEITGLDWDTGETVTRLIMGSSQAFNGAYSQVQILPDGDIVFGGLSAAVRISLPGENPERRRSGAVSLEPGSAK